MCALSWPISIVATDWLIDFLFFDPGGRPRRFAFLAMDIPCDLEAALIGQFLELCHRAQKVNVVLATVAQTPCRCAFFGGRVRHKNLASALQTRDAKSWRLK